MRVYLKIASTRQSIPFKHQTMLVGTIHKWLGWNEEHGNISLFSFSRLDGGTPTKNGLQFDNGASLFFSAYNQDVVKRLIMGIQEDPTMFCGLVVKEVILMEIPDLSNKEVFLLGSPVFIKRRVEDKIEHILFDHPQAAEFLTETLKTRLTEAGLEGKDFDIQFDNSYVKANVKLINYRGIDNKVNWCPIIINGDEEVKRFAWTVGVGNSTGIGFGSIK